MMVLGNNIYLRKNILSGITSGMENLKKLFIINFDDAYSVGNIRIDNMPNREEAFSYISNSINKINGKDPTSIPTDLGIAFGALFMYCKKYGLAHFKEIDDDSLATLFSNLIMISSSLKNNQLIEAMMLAITDIRFDNEKILSLPENKIVFERLNKTINNLMIILKQNFGG